ncbi:hypothetical protein B0F90DRAFT_1813472 [Multifurca ochricompacta]|uniref:KN homeodomain domain-containing protein n=1 Tax=Multifurca ochricompacta TaxID=376703 RepID=A0AAD4MD48_9AGAM|nr:hypothetical protein B0F90DRAFT_1813472 [Multifurca ochricompacta]
MNPTLHDLRERLIQAEQQFVLAVLANGEESFEKHSQTLSQLMEEDPRFHPPATIPDILFCRFSPSAPRIVIQQHVLSTHAHRWLMQNIHNPYPTPVEMQILGDASATSMAQVELWFREAGLLGIDKGIPFCIAFAFTAVKTSAGLLFLEHPALQEKQIDWHIARIPQSALSAQEHCLQGSSNDIAADPDSVSVLQDNPSKLSTNLTCFSESEEEDTTPPPSVAGCKRSLLKMGPHCNLPIQKGHLNDPERGLSPRRPFPNQIVS